MASMTCKEKILSEDYMDLINYFILPEGSVQGNDDVFCYIPINERFLSIYYSRAVLPPLEVSSYFYRYIPRLYGLMDLFVPEALDRNFDPQPLIRSGISFVQKEPLNLTGRNVVLGFADTGIDYRNPVFRREDGSTRILIGKDILLESIERASLLAKEGKNNLIKMTIKNDLLTITSRSEEGNVREEIVMEKEGDDLEIGFNSKFVIDVLKVIDDEEIAMSFKTGTSPCVVRPVDGDNY